MSDTLEPAQAPSESVNSAAIATPDGRLAIRRSRRGAVLVYTAVGTIDAHSVELLQQVLRGSEFQRPDRIIVDLSEGELRGHAGIRALLYARARGTARGYRVDVVAGDATARKLPAELVGE